MDKERPSWQVSECPGWCVQEHREGDRDGDRDHMSPGVYLPVIRLSRRAPGVTGPLPVVADEVVVGLFQRQQDSFRWVSLGMVEEGATRIDISGESAARLIVTLQGLLDRSRED